MFFQRVLTALSENGIDYAVVGGFAVSLHGAVRGTVDIDLVIHFCKNDFLKLEEAFKKLGLESRLPVRAEQVFDYRKEYVENKNLLAWNFYNPKKPIESVDVLLTSSYDEMTTQKRIAFGIEIKIASIEDLIRMKRTAGRPQDLADIEALTKLKKVKK